MDFYKYRKPYSQRKLKKTDKDYCKCRRCKYEWRIRTAKTYPHCPRCGSWQNGMPLEKRIRLNLSVRLWLALNAKNSTKTKNLKKYGIDVLAIMKKLGRRPSSHHDIDHIIPCSAFDLTDPEEVKKCFSPENLQWLDHIANIKKGGVKKIRFARRGT